MKKKKKKKKKKKNGKNYMTSYYLLYGMWGIKNSFENKGLG